MKHGWHKVTIGEVCDVVNGGTPKTGIAANWGGAHMWITPAEMGGRSDPYVGDTERQLTDVGLAAANVLPPRSVILSSRAPIGHLVINTVPMATNQGCKGLVPKPTLHHKYLFYYLGSIVGLLNDLGTGATFKELSGGKLKEVPLPLPPLPEQQRIVAILDEAFAGLATATANAEKNLKNARELFDNYLNSVFTQKNEGWARRTIDDIAEIKGGKRVPKGYKLLREPTKRPYISVSAFNDEGGIHRSELRYISDKVFEGISRYTISHRDVYVSIAGTIGKTGIIPQDLDGANLTENACRLVLSPDVSNKFVFYFTRTKSFKDQALANTRIAAQPKLALIRLKTVSLNVPPLREQEKVVSQLDDLSVETTRLGMTYVHKLSELAAFKQSILQKAFSGELTSPPSQAIREAAE